MIFDRPTKAFFALERAMMRPASWPPTRHDVPTLWERAKAMFAMALKAAGIARHLAQRYGFTRTARAEIVNRLKPRLEDRPSTADGRCCFPVIRWKRAEAISPQKPQATRLLCSVLADDSNFPPTHDLIPGA